MVHDSKPRCHYEVLGIERDANEATIKKAHRKQALIWHPDKNSHRIDEATHEFRLIQEAYECLSDKSERKFYDEHREAILKGHTFGGGGGDGTTDIRFVFDVIPYMHGGCYDGYDDNDDQDGFFQVYSMVFQSIIEGEIEGHKDAGNIELSAYLQMLQDVSFGSMDSDWNDTVSPFYKAWESFSSSLTFAWVDEYDTREAPNRRIRRAMEDANKKARKSAKRERNDDILALLKFVKKRDPRVKAHNFEVQKIRQQQAERQAEEEARKKLEKQKAREEWLAQQQALLEEEAGEENDVLDDGHVRLDDMDDDDDYFYADKRKKGKKKKNRGKKDLSPQDDGDKDNAEDENNNDEIDTQNDGGDSNKNSTMEGDRNNDDDDNARQERSDEPPGMKLENLSLNDDVSEEEELSSESESEDEEPESWWCECCKKEFKSEGQMNNHLKSKKHKETYKKYQAKMAKKEAEVMDSFLEER